MFRIALLASAVLVAASAVAVGSVDSSSAAVAATEPVCHPGQSFDIACAARSADGDANGAASPAEFANLAAPAPLAPEPGGGPAFQDAAIVPGTVLSSAGAEVST